MQKYKNTNIQKYKNTKIQIYTLKYIHWNIYKNPKTYTKYKTFKNTTKNNSNTQIKQHYSD